MAVSRASLAVAGLLLLAQVSQATDWGYLCLRYVNSNDKFYNLQNLEANDNTKYSLPGQKIVPKEGGAMVSADFLFNICGVRNSPAGCPLDYNSVGYITYNSKCVAISKAKGDHQTDWSYDAFNPDNKDEDGIKVIGNNSDPQAPYDITFAFQCDKTNDGDPTFDVSQPSNNRLMITVKNKKCCGLDFIGPFNFLAHYKWGFIFIGILVGSCLCFMGIRIFKYSLAILGFLVGFLVPFVLISLAWKDVDNDNKSVFIFIVSLVLGVVCAYFVYTMRNLGLFIAGCFLGTVIGLEVYLLGLYRTEKSDSQVVLYLTVILAGLVVGGLGLWLKTLILVITTAVGGSWLAFKCLGIAIGNYPNEFTIARSIKYGKFDGIPWPFYVYLGLTLLMAVAGMVYQYKLYKEAKEIEDVEAESGYKKV